MQKYALVSVEPIDSKTFQLACTTLPIDCVTIDMSKPWQVDSISLKRAAARGVFVELQLGGAAFTHSWELMILDVVCVAELVDCSQNHAVHCCLFKIHSEVRLRSTLLGQPEN